MASLLVSITPEGQFLFVVRGGSLRSRFKAKLKVPRPVHNTRITFDKDTLNK